MAAEKHVVFRVRRYQPQGDKGPFYQDYPVPYLDDMVVLDGLNYIKDNLDPSLTYRWSCRMGICGSCGMDVNSKPRLTCGAFIKDVNPGGVVQVDPLTGFNSIKDLVTDFDPFMEHFFHVKPWIIREKEQALDKGEYLQFPEELAAYRQQSLCINCTLCYAACPVFQGDSHFVGPASLAMALRYMRDSRDEGADERLDLLSTPHGIWECTFVGECSVVCPKEVDPAGAIQSLKVLATIRHLRKLLMPKFASR
jgi:fumarate reductase iron-sulfur subunit